MYKKIFLSLLIIAFSFVVSGCQNENENLAEPLKLKPIIDAKILEDGLTVQYGVAGAHSMAYLPYYHTKGKYYFETVFDVYNENNNLGWNNAGIISYTKNYIPDYRCDFHHIHEKVCYAYGISFQKSHNIDTSGDLIIGYAVDLNKGKIYISQNGEWVVGNPEKEETDYTFKPLNRKYSILLNVEENSTLSLKLTKDKFKYPVPNGFKPYIE